MLISKWINLHEILRKLAGVLLIIFLHNLLKNNTSAIGSNQNDAMNIKNQNITYMGEFSINSHPIVYMCSIK